MTVETLTCGRWSEPGFPHRGWQFLGEHDLGEPTYPCDMNCGAIVRYTHDIVHPQFPHLGVLTVGCICCDHLTQTKIASELEHARTLRENRRADWPYRVWKRTALGNYRITARGSRIVIFQVSSGWLISVEGRAQCKPYPTVESAKLAAFNIVDPPIETSQAQTRRAQQERAEQARRAQEARERLARFRLPKQQPGVSPGLTTHHQTTETLRNVLGNQPSTIQQKESQ